MGFIFCPVLAPSGGRPCGRRSKQRDDVPVTAERFAAAHDTCVYDFQLSEFFFHFTANTQGFHFQSSSIRQIKLQQQVLMSSPIVQTVDVQHHNARGIFSVLPVVRPASCFLCNVYDPSASFRLPLHHLHSVRIIPAVGRQAMKTTTGIMVTDTKRRVSRFLCLFVPGRRQNLPEQEICTHTLRRNETNQINRKQIDLQSDTTRTL